MTFNAGTKVGTYEIVGPLGKGGMGEVYRARDSRLKREVAVKVLPDAFARDAERVARFQREAEVLATLNHPHIAAIHHLEEFEDCRFLILELVEGETLAERIAKGPIPLDETLTIAKQIAEALEAAHEEGIIHRDLKPANIKLTPRGAVKVLDFGLAKVREGDSPSAVLTNSPTVTVGSTFGTIMGTAAYMSPEQAKGKEADRTSDVWAFGCVLYEMLTGRPMFEGETVNEILAGILKVEPDWLPLPPGTPEGLRRLLRRCLRKDKQERLQHMGDARIEIAEIQSGTETEIRQMPNPSRTKERLAWGLLLAIITLVAVIASALAVRLARPVPEMRVDVVTPPTGDPVSLSISPDGQKIVFVANSGGSRLWLRSLDSASARPLMGTDNGSFPFWSPDNRSIGFFADGRLKRIDIDGGSLQTFANTSANAYGGTWNRDGLILFSASPASPILRVSAAGGQPEAVTKIEAPQLGHRFPIFLPDGRHFLYFATAAPIEASGLYIGNLDGSQPRRLLGPITALAYTPSGQLLFARQGTLFAQNLDASRMELTGSPSAVAENVVTVSASAANSIAYRTGSGIERQFVWLDRAGKEIEKVGNPDTATPTNPALSPDGRRVAVSRTVGGNLDIWLLELQRAVVSRFTFDAAGETYPVWSPDGRRIVFTSSRKGVNDLYLKPSTGAGMEEPLLATMLNKQGQDWSPDGRFLLFGSPPVNPDIWALPMDGDRKPFVVVQTPFSERLGQFSPDGKWIAYESNESGRFEIYVQPFPGPGGKWQVSTNGGAQPRWRRDGKELFYIGIDERLMAAPIRFTSDGQSIEPSSPTPLFATHIGGAVQGTNRQQYVVSPDGQRFLMNTITEQATSPITVILNWKPKP
jgi:serine/threonine protein kinase